ncbi:hypothetical protein BHM03_00004144 [Ensete ventricosum]|uniref:Uncharacterized protein n=1 Tax=Ensete ventricosum TaxID=4639 RepID=A0A445MAD6_ENSVE|nr:hypothetical protein BHM03_00004144 [Ensete ventricosum]
MALTSIHLPFCFRQDKTDEAGEDDDDTGRTEHHRKRCTCHQRLPSSPLRSMEGSESLPQPMAVCACGCFISAYFSQSSAMGGVQFGTPCILDAGD